MAKAEMTGEYMRAMATEWRKNNADAWERMVSAAREHVAEGRRFSMETLFQIARYEMRTNGFSQGFKVNNNTRAALARMMRDENPGFEKYMDIRKSKVDEAA